MTTPEQSRELLFKRLADLSYFGEPDIAKQRQAFQAYAQEVRQERPEKTLKQVLLGEKQ